MRVLIIGGTGSISSYVADALIQRGDEVTIVSRDNNPVPDGYHKIIANRDAPDAFRKAISRWEGDVSIDFICFRPEHANNTYKAVNGRVKQHLFVSTAAIYDKSSCSCIPLTETSPYGARHWDYAQRKLECENFYREKHAEGFPVTIVRPSHTLGIGKIPAPIAGPKFTLAQRILDGKPIVLPDDGQTLWTLTSSWDFAKAMAGLVGHEQAIGEAFHITHDQVLTWNCIMFELGQALGVEPKLAYLPREVICEIDPKTCIHCIP